MKLTWALLAEGFGQDSKGALTVIGLNQNVLVADELPVQTKRALVVHLSDEDEPEVAEDQILTITFQVKSPSGDTIAANTVQVQIGKRKYPELPGGGDVPSEVILSLPEHGTYEFSAQLRAPGAHETATISEKLYVVKPS